MQGQEDAGIWVARISCRGGHICLVQRSLDKFCVQCLYAICGVVHTISVCTISSLFPTRNIANLKEEKVNHTVQGKEAVTVSNSGDLTVVLRKWSFNRAVASKRMDSVKLSGHTVPISAMTQRRSWQRWEARGGAHLWNSQDPKECNILNRAVTNITKRGTSLAVDYWHGNQSISSFNKHYHTMEAASQIRCRCDWLA